MAVKRTRIGGLWTHRSAFLLLVLLVSTMGFSQSIDAPGVSFSQYISEIRTDANKAPVYALNEVLAMVEGKDVVAMGEASHGAHEFFEIKAQMFKQLVLQKGYRMFAIESTLGATYNLNRFLAYGLGDAKAALSELDNGYWNSQEILDLILWMKAYNEEHPADKQLFFYGFDVNSRRAAAFAILKYISIADPAYFKEEYVQLRASLFSTDQVALQRRQQVIAYLESNQENCLKTTAPWEYNLAMRSFVNLQQIDSMPALSINARDKYMADNVLWIREAVQSKMLLFAHNFHVANHETRKYKTMGYHLERRLKAHYSPIGFDFYSGTVIAKKGRNVLAVVLNGNKNTINTVKPPKRHSFSDQMARVNYPVFCFNIERAIAQDSALSNWLQEPQLVHDLGAWCGNGHNQAPYKLSAAYDALIYVNQVSPSRHLVYPE